VYEELLLPAELDDEELRTVDGVLVRDVVTVEREVAVDVRGVATVTVSPLRLPPEISVVLGRVLIISEVREVVALVPVDLKVDSFLLAVLSCERTTDEPLAAVDTDRSTTRTDRSADTTEFRVTMVLSLVLPTLVEEPDMV